MPSGGARARSGPVRNPNALRRGRGGDTGFLDLPVAGREGDPPAWPLGRSSKFERETWVTEWQRPDFAGFPRRP